MSSLNALLYAGQALGLIDDTNSPSADFFAHPLATLEGMLRSKFRRERLIFAVDELLRSESPEANADSNSRYYPLLPDKLEGQLYLVAQLNADVDVTFALQGRFKISNDVAVQLDMPLVRAKGDGDPPTIIAGSINGKIRVGFVLAVNDVTVQLYSTAWIDEHGDPTGAFGIHMAGLVVDGTTLPEIEFSTDKLADGAVDAVLQILRFALDASGATATPIVRALADHLPGLFGLTSEVDLMFPFGELLADPTSVRAWLRQLASGDVSRLRHWFTHLAGLLDDSASVTTDAPVAASPWKIMLTASEATPLIGIEFWLEPGTDGFQRLVMALLIRFAQKESSRVSIEAQVEVMRFPLDGIAKTEMMLSGSVLVTAPPEGSMLIDTVDVKVGTLRGGVRWDASGVRPVLEVLHLQLPGTDKLLSRLDLTDDNALSDTVHQEAAEFIRNKLGATGNIASALLTLVGLDGGSPGVDVTLLTVAPTLAIADLHRRALFNDTWDDRYLRALGMLLGIDATEPIRGTGEPAAPWCLTVAQVNDVLIELTASVQTDGSRASLAVGLAFSSSTTLPDHESSAYTLSVNITVVKFDLMPDATATMLLPSLKGSFSIDGIDTILPDGAPLTCMNWSAIVEWERGGSAQFSTRIGSLSLSLPEAEEPLSLGDLVLPAAIDFSRSDLGLGLDTSGFDELLAHLLDRAIHAALPTNDLLGGMFANLIDQALLYSLDNLADFLTNPWQRLKTLVSRPFDSDGPLGSVEPDLLNLCSELFAGFDGYGTGRDIWSKPLGKPASKTLLTAWLSPAGNYHDLTGPEEDTPVWARALINQAGTPTIRALLGCQDVGALASQLDRLVQYLESGDGLVVPNLDTPPEIIVPGAHQDVIAHPYALAAILDKLGEWQTADPETPVVIIVPSLLGLATLDPLRSILSSAGEQIIDLNRHPGEPDPLDLTRYLSSPVHIIVNNDLQLDQLARVLGKLVELHAPHKLALIGVSVAAPSVMAQYARTPDVYTGVITVASPADGSTFDPSDVGLIDAIRFLRGLSLEGSQYERALAILLHLIDGWQVDESGEHEVHPPYELLEVDPVTLGAVMPALRIGGVCGEGLGDLLAVALLSADQQPPPQSLVLGLGAPFLPDSDPNNADLVIESSARIDLTAIGPTDFPTPALAFQIRVGRENGWLVGPSGVDDEVQVGGLDLSAYISLMSGDAASELVLTDVVVRGVHYAEVDSTNGTFARCLQQVVTELGTASATSSKASALLTWLADTLGILRKPAPISAPPTILADALAEFLDSPRSWLIQRAEAMLDTSWTGKSAAFFGLTADPTAPAGMRRWCWNSDDVPIRITVDDQPWTITVESMRGPVSVSDVLGLGGKLVITVGVETSVEWDIEIGLLNAHFSADGTITLTDPLLDHPVVISDLGGAAPAKILSQLAVPVGATLGAALLSFLFVPQGAELRLLRPLASLLAHPTDTLHDWLRTAPQAIADFLRVAASWAGLSMDGSKVTIFPDVLTFDLVPIDGRPTLTLATPKLLNPIPEISTKLEVALAIDSDRHVHPGLTAELYLDLGASPDVNAWPELGIRLQVDEQSQEIDFEIGDKDANDNIKWIELVPHFAGIGVFTGQLFDRLLPRTLDLIVENTPSSPIKTKAIDIAKELEVYKTSFSDGTVPLGQITAAYVSTHADALVSPVVDLLNVVVGTGLPPGTITAESNEFKFQLASVLSGQLNLTVAFDTLKMIASFEGVQIGPVLADLSVTSAMVEPYVVAALDIGLNLADAIGLAPRPTLKICAGSDPQPLSLELYPLGMGPEITVAISFVPEPSLTLTDTGKLELVEHFAILPGLHIVTLALGDLIDEPLWTNGPSLKKLLLDAQLMEKVDGTIHVAQKLPKPLDLIAGAGSSIAAGLDLKLSDSLSLSFGDDSGLGPQIRGYLSYELDSAAIKLLMGDEVGPNSLGPLAIDILTKDGESWKLKPRLRVNRTGVVVAGPKDTDLVTSDIVRFVGVGANIGFVLDVDLSNGTSKFSQFAAEVDLTGISIPILSGSGNDSNPIASGILSSGGGESPQPQFNVVVGRKPDGTVYLSVEGAEKGKPVWFVIDRGFGPLYIARIGIETDKELFGGESLDYIGVLLDAALSIAGLTVALKGLTVKLPPKYALQPDRWSFDLEGLAVSYQNSSVCIAGGLMKIGNGADTQYYGMLQVIVSGRGISALGGYGCTSRGDPSLFAFVVINSPLGGPPYLFLTGAAGGFGYNRKLLVPSNPERVPQFPLMAALSDDLAGDPGDPKGALVVLNQMAESIPPAQGMIWLAAGVKFTTFVLIETNAVLYVQFGNGFEVGLLGLMRARLPSESFSIAAIELGMLAKYSSVDNVLTIRAQLTANSWLFTKDCRLTGGFAFVVWFSKPQAILSLGGYHPDFQVPAYYPDVPRIGFRWTPESGICIKGESYFALTPEAAMTGGRLEARAEIDGVGHGEFVMYLDALLWFDPPHFTLDFGLHVSGEAFGFDFGVQADIHLELPPVYVRAHVDFMWGFDLEFGKVVLPRLLTFEQFTKKFLGDAASVCTLVLKSEPATGSGSQESSTSGNHAQDQNTVGKSEENPFCVLPEFEVATTTKFPAVYASYPNAVVSGPKSQLDKGVFLVPMGVGGGVWVATHSVSVTRMSDGQSVDGTKLNPTTETTGIPSAVYWDSRTQFPEQSDMKVNYSDMPKMINGITLRAESEPVNSPGLRPINIAEIVDSLAPIPFTLSGTPVAPDKRTRGQSSSAEVHAPAAKTTLSPRQAEAPCLKWEKGTGARSAAAAQDRAKTRSRSTRDTNTHQVAGLQMWLVSGASWRVRASRNLFVRQFNAMGRLITTHTVGRTASQLHPQTTAVTVQPAKTGRGRGRSITPLSGWQLHTLAHPITTSAFVTATSSVAFAAPLTFPNRALPNKGVRMYSLVASGSPVLTDLPISTRAVVIQLDQLIADIDPMTCTLVACDGADLRLIEQIDHTARDGRVHLVYEVINAAPEAAYFSVTVAIRPDANGRLPWLSAGIIGAASGTTGLISQLRADSRTVLVVDEEPDVPSTPTTLSFSKAEEHHG